MKTDAVEEFLNRGGKIQTLHYEGQWKDLKEMQKVSEEELKQFYKSPEWKSVRDEVYKTLTHFCPICGSEKNLVVDHINPVRYFWEQRLNKDNLQILCNNCNLEKKSVLNWSIEWHVKNKEALSNDRKDLQKKIYSKTKKSRLNEDVKKRKKRTEKLSKSQKRALLENSYPEKFLKG